MRFALVPLNSFHKNTGFVHLINFSLFLYNFHIVNNDRIKRTEIIKFPSNNDNQHPNNDEGHLKGTSNLEHNFPQSRFSSNDDAKRLQSRFAGNEDDDNFQKSRFSNTAVDQNIEVNTDWVVENNLNFTVIEHTQVLMV